MVRNISRNEPAALVAPNSPLAQREGGWTPDKQVGFLRMLSATQNVAQAARAVGMGRQSVYKLRARLSDGPFGAAWRMAMGGARDTLVEAALDRAVNGVEVPHYWQGELVGTSRRFDERLTAILLTSGVLDRPAVSKNLSEQEYAQADFARLLERIEHGPAHWCDFAEERAFAWGDDPDNDDLENDAPGDSGDHGWDQPKDENQ